MISKSLITLLLAAASAFALNFDFERDQLTEVELANSYARRASFTRADKVADLECKVTPGDADWPSEEDWASFNETLGGALLKPRPLGSVCYAGDGYNAARCEELKASWAGMNLQ